MDTLPEPLTPPDCDLRGYDYMPLFGARLFGSRLYSRALRHPRAGLAAIKLWWISWQQCPAGSLPDDDDDLAMLADFGTDLKSWKACRELALHGFIKCSDGRFYHPIIASEAVEAYARRRRERDRKAQMRADKARKSQPSGDGSPEDVPRDIPGTNGGTGAGHAADVRSDRTGQDRTEEKEERVTPPASQGPPRTDAARGSRLPDDWDPGPAGFAEALHEGVDPNRTFAAFRDYWRSKPGKDGRKSDWDATWRNWCRREADQKRGGSSRPMPREESAGERLRRELGLSFDDANPGFLHS